MSAYIVADETINRVISFLEADMRSEYTYSKRLILDAAEIDQSDEHWDIKLGYSMAHMNDIAQDARYGALRQFRELAAAVIHHAADANTEPRVFRNPFVCPTCHHVRELCLCPAFYRSQRGR